MKKTALFLLTVLTASTVLTALAAAVSGCSMVSERDRVRVQTEEGEDIMKVSTGRTYGASVGENRDFFVGADITEDRNISGIAAFEEKFPAHDIYADEIYIDEADKAGDFMLECYSQGKTPYIIIKNRDSIGTDDLKTYAQEFAEALGKYHIEVIVEILENSYYYDENGEIYKTMASLIKEKNDLAETVWSVKWDDIILVGAYMPDENVDYICINGYFSSKDDAQRMLSEIRTHLDTDKRAIFRFGASAYSTEDCVYTTKEALETISLVYDSVKKDMNAAGIIYMDKNIKLSDKVKYTDYSVTSNKELIEGYGEIIEDALNYRQEKGMKE